MGKQGRSSATSATRKKHARKAAAHDPSITIAPAAKSQGKGKGKGKNKEPRVKQYIPPPKHKPLIEDPIESLAVSSLLPSSMVLCFKGLSKKDPVTKTKALEELSNTLGDESWIAALPVWLWHFVPLSVHPSRRLRELTATLHSKLFEQSSIRDELQSLILRDPAVASFLAAWALGSNDIIPGIAGALKSSWDSNISWRLDSSDNTLIEISDHVDDMLSSILQAVVDPDQLYHQFAPLLARSTKDGIESSDAASVSEDIQDRDARIRTVGLNTLGWMLDEPPTVVFPALLPMIAQLLSSNPLMGTILCPLAQPPFLLNPTVEESNDQISWGHNQRGVRIAGWNFVKKMVKYLQRNVIVPEHDEPHLSLKPLFLSNLGVAALRSAWVETDAGVRSSMWEGFLPLITAFAEVWNSPTLLLVKPSGNDESDSDTEEEDDDIQHKADQNSTSTISPGQLAYADFLHFLEIGCHGSAIQSYPAIVVVLSSLPTTVFPYERGNLERFFASFWAAYDGKALNVLPRDREATFGAFLSSFLECAVFISQKLNSIFTESQNSGTSTKDISRNDLELVPLNWVAGIFTELVAGDLSQTISLDAAGVLVGGSAKKLERINSELTEEAWVSLWEPIFYQSRPDQTRNVIKLLAAMGSVIHAGVSGGKIDAILQKKAWVGSAEIDNPDPLAYQAQILGWLWEYLDLNRAPWLVEITSEVLNVDLMERLIRSGNNRGISHLLPRFINVSVASDDVRQTAWTQFIQAVIQTSGFEFLRNVLQSDQIVLPRPIGDTALHPICNHWVIETAQGKADHLPDLTAIIVHWDICLSRSQASEILESVVNTFISTGKELLFSLEGTLSITKLEPITQVLTGVLASGKSEEFWSWPNLDLAEMGALLLLLPVLPDHSSPQSHNYANDKPWKLWSLHASSELQSAAFTRAKDLIQILLTNCATGLSASDVLALATLSPLRMNERTILLEILPSELVFNRELGDLNDNPSIVLAEADPLVNLDEREPTSLALTSYDKEGFSKYVRLGSALTLLLLEDRQLAREKLWTFRHLVALQQLCSDFVSASFWPSDAFMQGSQDKVHSLLGQIAPLVIYLGNSLLVDHPMEWHKQLISQLQHSDSGSATLEDAQDVVNRAFSTVAQGSPSSRDLRLLRRIMQYVLRDTEPDVLDLWAGFASSTYGQYPEAASAIGSVLAARGIESPRLDRWRNEISSRIPGVLAKAINKGGLPLLRTLNCLAPPPDSGIIFLPQQRTVFLIQALQTWMSSDEELDSSLELLVTTALNHLLPILQTVPGAHWEFIFDVLEANLDVEGSSTNLYLLLQTLRAISSIQDLVHTNRTLRDVWNPRQHDVFQGVLKLFLAADDDHEGSETRDKYNACLAAVVQMSPLEQVQAGLFDQLLSLTSSQHIPIKTTAHHLARRSIAHITEQRVVEVAVTISSDINEESNPSNETTFQLPQVLIKQLTAPSTNHTDSVDDHINRLLSWWIALDFFENTSLKLKQGYIDQLRKLDIVKVSLIPCLFGLLKIGVGGEKPFNLTPWYVEEFYLNYYDTSLSCAPNVLAAHIFFKALKCIPALIRTWYSDCQDRQLASSFSSYTKAHFSPPLIKQELAQFRLSAASASEPLADDAFTIKVAPSVNEISATYVVDEQEGFEVAIRLPSEFPLRAAEVKDIRGVAGMENRRRAWVFGVQNAVQQGLIYDALAMYKKNVTGHFEGKSECAICYSLISVTDRTLPTKPCRTCKNLFHASCLYKWFNTSHTSTCPLCRSDIF